MQVFNSAVWNYFRPCVRLHLFSHLMRAVADGYWIIIIFSFVETMVVVALLYLRKWLSRLKANTVTRANESELFITAGRSLETGVISNAIVAQWTWAAIPWESPLPAVLKIAIYLCAAKIFRNSSRALAMGRGFQFAKRSIPARASNARGAAIQAMRAIMAPPSGIGAANRPPPSCARRTGKGARRLPCHGGEGWKATSRKFGKLA